MPSEREVGRRPLQSRSPRESGVHVLCRSPRQVKIPVPTA
jgi:hypothetical protein